MYNYRKYSFQAWEEWISELGDEGYIGYSKNEWSEWHSQMDQANRVLLEAVQQKYHAQPTRCTSGDRCGYRHEVAPLSGTAGHALPSPRGSVAAATTTPPAAAPADATATTASASASCEEPAGSIKCTVCLTTDNPSIKCVMCKKNEISVMYDACKHVCLCSECDLDDEALRHCPACNQVSQRTSVLLAGF